MNISRRIGTVGLVLAWFATVHVAYNRGKQQEQQQQQQQQQQHHLTADGSSLASSTRVFKDKSTVLSNAKCLPPPSTSLAFEQSFGFFDDISDDDWKMRRTNARNHRHHNGNPLHQWRAQTPASMFYYYNYEPLFSCPHLHRVGGPGDGPKWTCDPYRIKGVVERRRKQQQQQQQQQNHKNKATTTTTTSNSPLCLVYSIGCAGRYVWEDGLVELLGHDVCEFHIFDPGHYDRPAANQQRNMHYHSWGIKSSYHNDTRSRVIDKGAIMLDGVFETFPETLKLLGHENRTIDLLKADCEYCEWFSYLDWIRHGDVRQLMVETHHLPLPVTVTDYWPWAGTNMTPTQFFDDVQNAGYIMFSKEPNIHMVNKGNLVEWSFIKLHQDFLHGP